LFEVQPRLGRVFIADQDVERAAGLEQVGAAVDPVHRPLDVFVIVSLVLILIVLVADVVGGVGKDQIDAAGRPAMHLLNAVAHSNGLSR